MSQDVIKATLFTLVGSSLSPEYHVSAATFLALDCKYGGVHGANILLYTILITSRNGLFSVDKYLLILESCNFSHNTFAPQKNVG